MTDRKEALLVELGTEELPPRALERLSEAFRDRLHERLEAGRLEPGGAAERFATPRRLAVRFEAVSAQQRDEVFERLGPRIEAAWNKDGSPTRAAEGFAASAGVAVEDLVVVDDAKGQRVAARGTEQGQPLDAVLGACIEDALNDVPIPRRMRWGSGERMFVRPVKWLLVRHGSRVPQIEVFGFPAEGESRGHRFHHGGRLEVPDPESYEHVLQDPGAVVADSARRRESVLGQVRAVASELGGEPVLDEALLDEVTALVEWPVALGGSFDPAFLEVAEEALISSMQGHQRCFAVRDGSSGRLMPCFITVANLESRDPAAVRQGNERVIRPRLADAQFFWEQDRRRALADRLPELAGVQFHRKLGSLRDRAERIARGASAWAEQSGAADPVTAGRAGLLCKCDLLTEMVGEFPELQGIMGGHYARADGESPETAQGIREHYQPAYAGDAVPASPAGRAVSIADRVDALLGIFAADGGPTGDKDPFALRRSALGLVRCIIEGHEQGDLSLAFEHAAEGLAEKGVPAHETIEEVLRFCRERLGAYYTDRGVHREVLQAVEDYPIGRLDDFDRRVRACQDFLARPEAEALTSAQKRISNLLKKAGPEDGSSSGSWAEGLREGGPVERDLARAVESTVQAVEPMVEAGRYGEALDAMAGLQEPVDAFFEQVMVMSDEPAVRARRLSLLRAVRQVFLQVADVSRLPVGR